MGVVHIERGRIIEADSHIVSFLWSNWDIGDAVIDSKFNIRRISEKLWKCKYHGLEVQLELIAKEEKENDGSFKFLITGSKFGLTASIVFDLSYSANAEGKTAIQGMAHMEIASFSAFIWKLLKYDKKAQEIADDIIESGDRCSTMLYKNYKQAIMKLTDQQREILENNLGKLEALSKDHKADEQKHLEVFLNIFPMNGDSLIQYGVNTPRFRKIRETIKDAGSASQAHEDLFNAMLNKVRNYRALSRGSKQSEALREGEKCFSELIKIGRHLHSSYIPDNINAHLSALTDQSLPLLILIESEGRDSAMPWEILHDGEHFIALKNRLARTISGVKKPSFVKEKLCKILLLGSNPYGDLEKVEQELSVITEAMEGVKGVDIKTLTGREATRKKILQELETGDYHILHYAGHSEYNNEEPRLSHLLLHDGNKLSASELALQTSKNGLFLILLNSCSSGIYQPGFFNTTGIASAFVSQGVPYVIGMMWDVTDEGAFILAKTFYENLISVNDPIEALRKAKLETGGALDWNDPTWAAPLIFCG